MKFNIIDGEIKEPVGGAHTNYEEVSANMKKQFWIVLMNC